MNTSNPVRQQGAVLLIALVVLLVITVLAVTNMRGVVLESRITANRTAMQKLQEQADAALREAEFRYYGPAHLRSKLEFVADNCTKNNKLVSNGLNKPCLLKEMEAGNLDDTRSMRMDFLTDPLGFFKQHTSYASAYGALTGSAVKNAANTAVLAWMPYRGTSHTESNYFVAEDGFASYWNSYLITSSADESEAINPEYGAVLEGRGTYYYLANGQANDEMFLQSTFSNIYVGLNN